MWSQVTKTNLAGGALLALMAMSPVHAGKLNTLTVQITNIGPRGGNLHVGVYTEKNFESGAIKPVMEKIVPATRGTRNVTFVGLKTGNYAVKVLQDIDKNGRLGHTMFGSRNEPIGYSRNYSMHIKPSFRDARFSVTKGDNKVHVRMH